MGNEVFLLISMATAFAILIIKLFSTLLVYNFFSFDKYLTGVGVFFLLSGYFLFQVRQRGRAAPHASLQTVEKNEMIPNQKIMRYSLTNREFTVSASWPKAKQTKKFQLYYILGSVR